ncbi:CLM8 protein, partial [Motacilla alba]|nr:CLM8 protein [Motacilla alba]
LQGQTPETQRRREGDTLYIQCPYTPETTRQHTKYWCLPLGNKQCQEVVRTYSESIQQSHDGRTKIKDDPTTKTVSVTMADLKAEDSGTYFCALYKSYYDYPRLRTISLNVFKGEYLYPTQSQAFCSGNTFVILSVVLLILLLLALLTSIALGVRYYKLLLRTGIREAQDTSDRADGTAQPGSTGRRESSQDDSKGSAYINLDVKSHPNPEDPLYCNVEPSQAARSPRHVEYAVIAFNPSPRTGRE